MDLKYLMNSMMSHLGGLYFKMTDLLNSVIGWIVLAICQLFMVAGFKAGFIGLGILYCLDLITGIGASWVENKKDSNSASSAPYFIESKKIRGTLIKAIVYSLFVLMSYILYITFFNGTTNLPMSDKEFNIVSITFALCMSVEVWSILENSKRMGYDIIGRLKKAFKEFWNVYDDVKRS